MRAERSAASVGIWPENELEERSSHVRDVSLPTSVDRVPLRLFVLHRTTVRDVADQRPAGRVPVNTLPSKVRELRLPYEFGMLPEKEL